MDGIYDTRTCFLYMAWPPKTPFSLTVVHSCYQFRVIHFSSLSWSYIIMISMLASCSSLMSYSPRQRHKQALAPAQIRNGVLDRGVLRQIWFQVGLHRISNVFHHLRTATLTKSRLTPFSYLPPKYFKSWPSGCSCIVTPCTDLRLGSRS